MARPKNMMIDGKAVKSVKINGQLWWEKRPTNIEWKLEGLEDDTVYTYENYIDGTPLVLTVVNNTGIPSERYRIYDREGNSLNELEVYFDSDTCHITVTEWPKVNPLELKFTDDIGSGYEYDFILTLEPLRISISPSSIQYIPDDNMSFESFAVEGNIPIQNISYNTSESYQYFNIDKSVSENNGKRIVYDLTSSSYAADLTDGTVITVPFYAQGYQGGSKNDEAMSNFTIYVTTPTPEHTYEIVESDTVYGAYREDYWDATIHYTIYRDGEPVVINGEKYYSKLTNGQKPPYTDTYMFTIDYYDTETGQEIPLTLTGEAYIND